VNLWKGKIRWFLKKITGGGKMKRVGILLGLFLLIVSLGLVGCNSGGSSSGSNGSTNAGSEFVGSWALSDSSGTDFYLYIESNNTFVIADVPDKNRVHMSGTGSVANGTFKGPFENPGVGTGDLVCTIANGVMTVDFIEHWHSPDKHIPFTGRKL
jgi:hypothetical protein